MPMQNLFDSIPERLPEELLTTLLEMDHIRIERIVSDGHSSPPGFWYDQPWNEWVVVLQGSARLVVEAEPEPLDMKPGSFINIPAHRRHRVVTTDARQKTVWLAIHYER